MNYKILAIVLWVIIGLCSIVTASLGFYYDWSISEKIFGLFFGIMMFSMISPFIYIDIWRDLK